MPVVKVISPTPQRYNLQGFGLPVQFEPGEFYNVPDFAARNMAERNWVRLATDEDEIPADIPAAADLPQPPMAAADPQPPVHAKMTTPPVQAQSAPPPAEPATTAEPHAASPAGRSKRR